MKRTTAERIENLEAEVASLRRATRSATARTAFAANATHIVGLSATDAGGATLEFTKAEGSPNFVRVSVRGHPGYVINVGEKSGELKGLTAGTFIIVRMEVQGNPLDKATVKFNEGSPDVMTIEIPKDDNANSGVQTVAVL